MCDELVLGIPEAKDFRALLYLAHGKVCPFRARKKKRKDFADRYRGKKMRILQQQGYECLDCGREISIYDVPNQKNEATFEHVIPYRYGSSMSDHNIVLLCGKCNRKRDQNFSLQIIEDHYGPIDWEWLRSIPIVEIEDV